ARGEHLADERRAATREVVDEAGRRDRAGRRFAQGLDAGLEREDERERARERALDGLVEERLGEPDVVEPPPLDRRAVSPPADVNRHPVGQIQRSRLAAFAAARAASTSSRVSAIPRAAPAAIAVVANSSHVRGACSSWSKRSSSIANAPSRRSAAASPVTAYVFLKGQPGGRRAPGHGARKTTRSRFQRDAGSKN